MNKLKKILERTFCTKFVFVSFFGGGGGGEEEVCLRKNISSSSRRVCPMFVCLFEKYNFY